MDTVFLLIWIIPAIVCFASYLIVEVIQFGDISRNNVINGVIASVLPLINIAIVVFMIVDGEFRKRDLNE